MSRTFYIIIAAVTIAIVTVAAIGIAIYRPNTATSSTLKVIATFYPLYDFAQNVGGNKVTVSVLVPETTDVHDFEPTPSSIEDIASANVIIYNGAGLEPWIQNVINSAENSKLIQVDASSGIQLLPVPQEFQSNGQTIDPHIWLDPELAKQEVNNILQGFIQADPADSQYFTQNAQAYQAKLDDLNNQAINATTNVATRTFVTLHEAFAYFAQQYNLTQAPILGPFEEDPTATDIQNVVNFINQNHILYVGYESLESSAYAQSVSDETQTHAQLILMDPIEGLTAAQKSAGYNYITLMQLDIQNIGLALSHVGN